MDTTFYPPLTVDHSHKHNSETILGLDDVDAAIAAHDAAPDPHPGYITTAEQAAALAFVGCRAYADGSQSFSDQSFDWVQFQNELFDTDNIHGADVTKFTVPAGKAGKWRIEGRVVWSPNAGGTLRRVQPYKNGSSIAGVYAWTIPPSAVAFSQTLWFADVLVLAAGDYIQLQGIQDRGGSLPIDSGFIVVQYLGA